VLRSLHRTPGRSHGQAHTAEEVKLIVSGIRKRGLLDEEQEEMIHSVFDLDRVRVREIMVAWNRITCLPVATDLPALLERVVKDQHSRIPVYDGPPDQIVGVLYTKDLLGVMAERARAAIPGDAGFDLRTILHQPMIVPEGMSLTQMLKEARRRHSQMALVVDEFGTFVGLVTIEDVLEQIVGEIQDEYDREESAVRKVGENVLVVDASMSLRDLASDRDIVLPRGEGYETLAGFVLARLGFIPHGGESFIFEFRRYTVLEVEGRRVSRIRIETLPQAQPAVAPSPETAREK
jgi:CBS domain containing-hemolysin-like protein